MVNRWRWINSSLYSYMKQTSLICQYLTHWHLHKIARDPPPIPWCFFFKYFRASKGTKINHMRSNQRHKIRFQDILYLKLNKWRAKILKYINKKNSNWCVKLIRKQEIFFFFAGRQKQRKLNTQNWVNFQLQRTKQNRIQ